MMRGLLFLTITLAAADPDCGGTAAVQSDYSGKGSAGVEKLLSEDSFNAIFASSIDSADCVGPNVLTYAGLVAANKLDKLASLFNSGDYDTDAQQLAAFLAFVTKYTHASGAATCKDIDWGLCFKEEYVCKDDPNSKDCPARATDGDPCKATLGFECPPAANKKYFGRGSIMLSGNANYAGFSNAIYGDPTKFLNDPDKLASDPEAAWASGMWLFTQTNTPQVLAPADIMAGKNVLTNKGLMGGFGLTIVAQNRDDCPSTCDGPGDVEAIFADSYKRITTMLGCKLCMFATDRIHCFGMKYTSGPKDSTCTDEQLGQECKDNHSKDGSPVTPAPNTSSTGPADSTTTPAVKPSGAAILIGLGLVAASSIIFCF